LAYGVDATKTEESKSMEMSGRAVTASELNFTQRAVACVIDTTATACSQEFHGAREAQSHQGNGAKAPSTSIF
jgi:hypothetical protein